MKKILRIAFVFALAGATLMYTGCSKDYSEDIDKLDMEIQSVAGSIQSLQSQVVNALSEAQKALTEAQAAAKAAANAGTAASANADAIKAANAEVAKLEARVAALEAALAKLDTIEAALADKANKADVDSALAELQAKIDELLAQPAGEFSISTLSSGTQTAKYFWSTWAPQNTIAAKKQMAKLVEAFPELADINKGDELNWHTAVDFIVTPAEVTFDDTDVFSLVTRNGEDSGFKLGKPFASPYNTKAGTAGVWSVDILAPAVKDDGTTITAAVSDLALVVEKQSGAIAQTTFDYKVDATQINHNVNFNLSFKNGNTISLVSSEYDRSIDVADYIDYDGMANNPLYDNYFVVEPKETDILKVEKYDITVNGSEIKFGKLPTLTTGDATVNFTITGVGLNGRTAEVNFTVKIKPDPIATNAELAEKSVVLGYNATTGYDVYVDYAVADFGLKALEWDSVFNSLLTLQANALTANRLDCEDADDEYDDHVANGLNSGTQIIFLDANKNVLTTQSSLDAKYIRIVIASDHAVPGEYSVKITDGTVFCAVGNITVANPTAKPIKLSEELCEDGVLQIVGGEQNTAGEILPKDGLIVYNLADAFVKPTNMVGPTSFIFKDIAYELAKEETSDQTSVKNWITNNKFQIPVQGQAWDGTTANTSNPAQKLLNTEREFAVTFHWFVDNSGNTDTLHFKAQAVSPIWTADGSNITLNTDAKKNGIVSTIYYVAGKDEPISTTLTPAMITGGTYVAGTKKGSTFEVKASTTTAGTSAGWHQTQTIIPDVLSTTTTAPIVYNGFELYIASSNVNGTNLTAATPYPVGNDDSLVEISLSDALKMGFITSSEKIECEMQYDEYHYYLTYEDWEEVITDWVSLFKYGYKYDGKRVGSFTGNPDENGVINATNNAENAFEALKDTDAKKYARIEAFDGLLAKIHYTKTTNLMASDATKDPSSTPLAPAELLDMPFFKFEGDVADYKAFATILNNANGSVTITSVSNNPAGRKTVKIPVYANVKDKWGMTTKKKVEVTLMVK